MTNETTALSAEPDNITNAATPKPTGTICSNCGTQLLGEHCYHCGQPVKGLVRRFSSVLGDIADTLFEIDTRLTRTVAPLLLRPGFLSREYFAGRRVRYVSPVRLFFFVSVIAFFVAQWTFDSSNTQAIRVDDDGINSAMTVEAVDAQRNIALHAIQVSKKATGLAVPAVADSLSVAEAAVNKKADARIAELRAAIAKGLPPPVHKTKLTFGDDDKPWDPVTNPYHSNALPAFANRWLNQLIGRAQDNFARIQQEPKLLVDAVLSALPSTLFLLMPLFAVLLKLAYMFKRRLYMEHFIVALHSHAFLCFALLLVLVLNGLAGVTPSPWMHAPLEWAKVALIVWMPLYLLLMQKRVYGQGWIMTVIKYSVIGYIYVLMLALGVVATLLVKLVWL
jgi:anti-sigma28 factor (negative regulator of flagellin synthesis)